MRLLLFPLIGALVAGPLVAATPDPATSTADNHYEGTLVEGETDDLVEWYAALFGEQLSCSQSIDEVLFVLTIDGGAWDDVVTLRPDDTWLGPVRPTVNAMHHAPATLYWQNSDSCIRFTVTGANVETSVHYVLDIHHCSFQVVCVPGVSV